MEENDANLAELLSDTNGTVKLQRDLISDIFRGTNKLDGYLDAIESTIDNVSRENVEIEV